MQTSPSLINYLHKRELGFIRSCHGYKNNMYEHLIGKMRVDIDNLNTLDLNIGCTFSCKFSKHVNNLHIIACSTENGEVIIQNTYGKKLFKKIDEDGLPKSCVKNIVHSNAIFNLAWSDSDMKLVTASGDQTSKLIVVLPSGQTVPIRTFNYNASVKCTMFCPGSSNVFCGGTVDGSIKVWDARVNNNREVIGLEHHIPNAHSIYFPCKKNFKHYAACAVLYQNELNVISCAGNDPAIKLWDLRKSYRQVKANNESLPLKKFILNNTNNIGFVDLAVNPESTLLYANGLRNIIYCFSLDSAEKRTPLHNFSSHHHETPYSKISLSYDGQYIFSGCTNKTGIIYYTGFPHIGNPIYKLNESLYHPAETNLGLQQELSISDWCADPATHPKLITSGDSLPLLWSVQPRGTRKSTYRFIKTHAGNGKKYFHDDVRTVPIKLDAKLKDELRKETEEHMKTWDLKDKNPVPNIGTLIPKSKVSRTIVFSKNYDTSTQLLPKSNASSDQKRPEVVTPKCQKRKKSNLSPKSLIDRYLVPNKREKLDTVKEN